MRLLTALIFTSLVTPAFATWVLTPPVNVILSSNLVLCSVVNVSSKPLDVTVSLVDVYNRTIATQHFAAIAPAITDWILGIPYAGSEGLMRCGFEFSGSPKSVRASIEVLDQSTNLGLVALPAS